MYVHKLDAHTPFITQTLLGSYLVPEQSTNETKPRKLQERSPSFFHERSLYHLTSDFPLLPAVERISIYEPRIGGHLAMKIDTSPAHQLHNVMRFAEEQED